MTWGTNREMDTSSNLGAPHLARKEARWSRLLPGAGHSRVNAYLKRFKERDEEACGYCGFPVEDAEHIFFVCDKWRVAKGFVGRAVSAELIPDTMVPLILKSEESWKHIESFVTQVITTKNLNERMGWKIRVGPRKNSPLESVPPDRRPDKAWRFFNRYTTYVLGIQKYLTFNGVMQRKKTVIYRVWILSPNFRILISIAVYVKNHIKYKITQ